MTAREELIEKIGDVIYDSTGAVDDESALMIAAEIVNLALPQVRTVAELEALDRRSLLVDDSGIDWRPWQLRHAGATDDGALAALGLTVVWQPEVTA